MTDTKDVKIIVRASRYLKDHGQVVAKIALTPWRLACQHFDDDTDTCTCLLTPSQVDCDLCRERFVWVDGTPVNGYFAPWSGSEPGSGEKCVRLTDSDINQRWSGSPCSTELDYACLKGTNDILTKVNIMIAMFLFL